MTLCVADLLPWFPWNPRVPFLLDRTIALVDGNSLVFSIVGQRVHSQASRDSPGTTLLNLGHVELQKAVQPLDKFLSRSAGVSGLVHQLQTVVGDTNLDSPILSVLCDRLRRNVDRVLKGKRMRATAMLMAGGDKAESYRRRRITIRMSGNDADSRLWC